jgi:hypothetical protein
MIQPTNYRVDKNILTDIATVALTGKLTLNEPTGDFFYDPWKLKKQFIGTAVETALAVLPFPIGEARLITLKSGTCYFSHSDIDDRFHLNISGDCSALINLESGESYFLKQDYIWYKMDAGIRHSAVNYGQFNRTQLVVRKLLNKNKIHNSVNIEITPAGENSRYVFDNILSPWLNRANKNGTISNFSTNNSQIYFKTDQESISELKKIIPKEFVYTIS